MCKVSRLSRFSCRYDEGLAFFRDVLGFAFSKTPRSRPAKRWVVVAPRRTRRGAGARGSERRTSEEPALATRPADASAFSFTPTISGRIRELRERGVNFLEMPRREPYGLVAVFVDPWGGKWDLLQPASAAPETP